MFFDFVSVLVCSIDGSGTREGDIKVADCPATGEGDSKVEDGPGTEEWDSIVPSTVSQPSLTVVDVMTEEAVVLVDGDGADNVFVTYGIEMGGKIGIVVEGSGGSFFLFTL